MALNIRFFFFWEFWGLLLSGGTCSAWIAFAFVSMIISCGYGPQDALTWLFVVGGSDHMEAQTTALRNMFLLVPYPKLRWTPHPVIVTIRNNKDCISVHLHSYYATITGWGGSS